MPEGFSKCRHVDTGATQLTNQIRVYPDVAATQLANPIKVVYVGGDKQLDPIIIKLEPIYNAKSRRD
jgi:hypothetical protein